jgi:DNA-binding beta-propeller fold protein YncE
MKKISMVLLLSLFAVAQRAPAQEKPPLKLIETTPLPGFSGDFDHLTADLKGNRLFLAAEDHKTVEVFDLKSGKPIHSITGFGQPHALVYLPDSNKLIVTDGDDFGRVALVNGENYETTDTIKLPDGVDGAVFNPINKYYYVESGGKTEHQLNIIDTKNFKHVGDITLPGNHSEAMVIDRAGKKMYVNLTAVSTVGVVDLQSGKLTTQWPIADAKVQNSMALDEANHRLFIATRMPPKFFVLDTESGKIVASLLCAPINDDMWFDVARKRVYVTGSDTTSVIAQRDADHYEQIAEIPTGFRAKTSLYIPQLNRLYVAVSGKGKPDAKLALQIYQVQ